MCGIYGLASSELGKNSSARKEAFINGLIFNMVRGWDGTGIAAVKEIEKDKSNVSFYKRALDARDFIQTKGAGRLFNEFERFYYVIGHCRASTRGSAADRNAHPFTYGHITLAHNGTISEHLLPKKGDETVDSAAIAASMAEVGEKETLEKLEGAFALVWYNAKDDSLNMARNKRKPLAFAFVQNENTMHYGSEWATLNAILIRNNILVDGPKVTDEDGTERIQGKVLIPMPFVWYKFHREDLRAYEKTTFEEYHHPIPPRHPPVGNRGWAGADQGSATVHQPLLGPPSQQKMLENSRPKSTTQESTVRDMQESDTDVMVLLPEKKHIQGIPAAGPRVKLVAQRLSKFGLDFGRLTIMKPQRWNAYKNQHGVRGVMHGIRSENETPLVMYNVTMEQWKAWGNRGKIAVRAVNVRHNDQLNNGRDSVIVVIDTKWEKVFNRRESKRGDNEEPASALPAQIPEERPKELFQAEDKYETDIDIHEPISLCGPGGSQITKKKWLELTKNGCGGCTGVVSSHFHAKVLWVADCPICDECADNPGVLHALGLAGEPPARRNLLN